MSTDHPHELISALVDGEVPEAERARLEAHLRDCAACHALLADFRSLAAAARREAVPEIPVDLAARIGARSMPAPSAPAPSTASAPRHPLFRMRLPLATAAAALLLVSLWVVWQGRIPERIDQDEKAIPMVPPSDLSAPAVPGTAPAGSAPAAGVVPRELKQEPLALREVETDERRPPGSRTIPPPARADAAAPPPAAVAPPPAASAPAAAMRKAAGAEAPPALLATAAVGVDEGIAGPTLVFHLPEGRVSVTSDHLVTITSGDYLCRLPAIDPAEDEALDGLFALARAPHDRDRPATGFAPAPEAVRREIAVPASGEPGALSPGVSAEMRRRLRSLLVERYLARAEATCGPPPAALRQMR